MSKVGFTSINWKNLKALGGGSFGAVFTDGVYAIKIGTIDMAEVEALREYSKYGLAVPVHFATERMYIPSRIRDILHNMRVPVYGKMRDFTDWYGDDKYYGVVIMGIATPIVDSTVDSDHVMKRRCNKIISWLHKRIDDLGIEDYFGDDHEYNIGVYNGNPVILDLQV